MLPRPAAPGGRAESREIKELRRLKEEQPDLATAVDLQIALLELQRRVQGRVPLPLDLDASRLRHRTGGYPLLRFEDVPLNWSDFRLMFREATELLRRFDELAEDDYRQIQALLRDGDALPPLVAKWYDATGVGSGSPAPELSSALQQVLLLACRPFLARCAEVLMPRLDSAGITTHRCPLCGGEPEFAVITQAADRLLVCSRCTARWRFAALVCPFCQNDDRQRITSFASRDGQYRIAACDVCQRYLKAYDARHGTRPVMVPYDLVATLPLDAAAIQRGYR